MTPYTPEPLPAADIDYAPLVGLVGRANAKLARYDGLLRGIVNPGVLLSPRTQALLGYVSPGSSASRYPDTISPGGTPANGRQHPSPDREAELLHTGTQAPRPHLDTRRSSMPRSRYRFIGNDAPYFMTMTVNYWLPVFTRPETVEILLDSWRYLREHHGFRLHG